MNGNPQSNRWRGTLTCSSVSVPVLDEIRNNSRCQIERLRICNIEGHKTQEGAQNTSKWGIRHNQNGH